MKKTFLFALLFLTGALSASATVYYLSPTGNQNNTGLSPSSPLPLGSGLNSKVVSGNTFILLDGTYNAGLQPNGSFQIWNTGMQGAAQVCTFQAQHKWAAIIAYGSNNGFAPGFASGYETPMICFDGLQVCSNTVDGVEMCTNSILRNCWIHDNTQMGAQIYSDTLVERNLFERNGTDSGFFNGGYHYHNLYVYGRNCTVRYNVTRLSQYGYGFQFYCDTPGAPPYTYRNGLYDETNNWIYGNLSYSNGIAATGGSGRRAFGGDIYGAAYDGSSSGRKPGTNYVFGNAFLDGVWIEYGTLYFTNNILTQNAYSGQSAWFGSGPGSGPSTVIVKGDYNAITFAGDSVGSHDVTTTFSAMDFVGSTSGLFWHTAGSSLVNAALATIHGTNDWWGVTQGSVADIGPYQYNATYATDSRTLDPSPAAGADYWYQLTSDPAITVQPQSTTVAVGSAASFSVTATGTPTLTYQWTYNGANIAGATTSALSVNPTYCTNNGALYAVQVTSGAGGPLASANATLTLSGCSGTLQPNVATMTLGGARLSVGSQ
jgi:hypothetical protein